MLKNNIQTSIQPRSNLLRTDSIIAVLIIITPIIFYSYQCFPSVKTWETSLFTYTSKYYENVSTFMWVFLQKFVFLYLMIIWYFTCRYWWNKAILVPIGMLLYQTINLLNDEIKFKDEALDFFIVIPLSLGVCLFLIILRNKISSKIAALDLMDTIDREIEKVEKEIND